MEASGVFPQMHIYSSLEIIELGGKTIFVIKWSKVDNKTIKFTYKTKLSRIVKIHSGAQSSAQSSILIGQ